jgi:hypothetical protein
VAEDLHQFIRYLSKSELLKSTKLSLDDFVEQLLSQEVITAWQCEKLKRGQYKGFYLDDFLLLDFDHVDSERSYYVARNLKTGELNLLGIYPAGDEPVIRYDALPLEKD